jgi:hypothetical protein
VLKKVIKSNLPLKSASPCLVLVGDAQRGCRSVNVSLNFTPMGIQAVHQNRLMQRIG